MVKLQKLKNYKNVKSKNMEDKITSHNKILSIFKDSKDLYSNFLKIPINNVIINYYNPNKYLYKESMFYKNYITKYQKCLSKTFYFNQLFIYNNASIHASENNIINILKTHRQSILKKLDINLYTQSIYNNACPILNISYGKDHPTFILLQSIKNYYLTKITILEKKNKNNKYQHNNNNILPINNLHIELEKTLNGIAPIIEQDYYCNTKPLLNQQCKKINYNNIELLSKSSVELNKFIIKAKKQKNKISAYEIFINIIEKEVQRTKKLLKLINQVQMYPELYAKKLGAIIAPVYSTSHLKCKNPRFPEKNIIFTKNSLQKKGVIIDTSSLQNNNKNKYCIPRHNPYSIPQLSEQIIFNSIINNNKIFNQVHIIIIPYDIKNQKKIIRKTINQSLNKYIITNKLPKDKVIQKLIDSKIKIILINKSNNNIELISLNSIIMHVNKNNNSIKKINNINSINNNIFVSKYCPNCKCKIVINKCVNKSCGYISKNT